GGRRGQRRESGLPRDSLPSGHWRRRQSHGLCRRHASQAVAPRPRAPRKEGGMTSQRDKARRFHPLHRAGHILRLPNAWDAASARVFELAGSQAIATTSAGVAAALGYPDGEHVRRELMIPVVERIVATVDVPVSVDAEAGYGGSVDDVRE